MRSSKDGQRTPVEITDAIIDHLHANRKALKTCSLVHKDWEPAARFHLFSTMSASPEKCPFSELVAFLSSKDNIVQHVAHFSLSGYRGIGFADLEALLKPLTNLRTLEISGVYISKSPSDHEVTSMPIAPSLDSLRITECNVIKEGVDVFFRLLGFFSGISNLHLSTWRVSSMVRNLNDLDDLESRIALMLPSHVQIANLTLGSLPLKFMARLCHPWSRPFWGSVRSISIEDAGSSWAEIKQLGKVFAALGAQLHRVSIKPSHRLVAPDERVHAFALGLGALAALNTNLPPVPAQIRDTKRDWKALRLQNCTTLDAFTLTLDHNSSEDHRRGREAFSTAVDLLTHLPSCVRQVRIDMIPHFNAGHANPLVFGNGPLQEPKLLLEDLNWHALDKVLSVPRFKNLTVICEVVRLENTFTRERCWKVVDSIREGLPLLSSRNMLAFDVRDKC